MGPLLLIWRLTARRPAATVDPVSAAAPGHRGPVAVVTGILVVLATIKTIFITQATVPDAQHPSALACVFGATPGQVSAGLTVAQLLPAMLAGILSTPAGTFVYRVAARAAGSASHAAPPLSWMRAVVVGTAVAVAVLTPIPARVAARRPIAVVLAAG